MIFGLTCSSVFSAEFVNSQKAGDKPPTVLPLQPAGKVFTDPDFNTELTRITDYTTVKSSGNKGSNVYYSYFPTFNSNSTKLFFNYGGVPSIFTFDPITMKASYLVKAPCDEGSFWSHTNPDIIYYISHYQKNPNTQTNATMY
jgi:hypothetical protein